MKMNEQFNRKDLMTLVCSRETLYRDLPILSRTAFANRRFSAIRSQDVKEYYVPHLHIQRDRSGVPEPLSKLFEVFVGDQVLRRVLPSRTEENLKNSAYLRMHHAAVFVDALRGPPAHEEL
jgi:hypothetical protein